MNKFLKLIWLPIVLVIAGGIFIFWVNKETQITTGDHIRSIIAGFDFKNPQSFYSVAEIAKMGEKTIPYLQKMIKSDSIYERWSAIISLSTLLRKNPNLKDAVLPNLKEALNAQNDTLRMLAAAELISFGEKDGIPVLISCLNSEEITHFGEPPELVKERSLIYLQHYIGFDGKTAQEWQQFWGDNKDALSWNKTQEIFEVK